MTIDEIIDNFAVLDYWDDRYRYVIELGRELAPLPEAVRTDVNKVQGCASQVWLATSVEPNGAGGPVLTFAGDSDAHIVRGLIAILFAFYSANTRARFSIAMPSRCSISSACASISRRNARTASSPWSSASRPMPVRPSRLPPDRNGLAYLARRRRCWPRPICRANCERAAA